MMQEISVDAKSPKQNRENKKSLNLKNFDIYQKVDESYRVQTITGAILSIIGWVIIIILLGAEIRSYLTPRIEEHMMVDTRLNEQIKVNINITFHALTCNEVHLDVMDIAGDNQLNVEHEMIKQRLTSDGKKIGKAGVEIIGEGNLNVPDLPPNYCGSCYGAESETRKCCNTCNELLAAYQEKQWSFLNVLKNSTQCIHDRMKHFSDVQTGEGCTISGVMKVNKVAGNFHIAHGESVVKDGRHIHHFNPAEAHTFNISHTIHSLSFGDDYPHMPANPLDSTVKILGAEESTGLMQYFIKVIPTVFTDGHRRIKIATNQYTVSSRFRPLILPKLDGTDAKVHEAILPGIFFVFDLSPFMIEARRNYMPLSHIITKMIAITGGVLTILSVFDGLLHKIFGSVKRNKL